MKRSILLAGILGTLLGTLPLQSLETGTSIGLGVVSFSEEKTGETISYQLLALRPHLTAGKFSLGLNLEIHYRFTGGDGQDFEIREEDWNPRGEMNVLELYLPKIDYLRYGQKGDSLFLSLGSFSDATLGNGFIMESYSNQLFRPERPLFGALFDLDALAVGLPYGGIETVVANTAAWDVIAGRLFIRPLGGMNLPLLSRLQVGGTLAVDRDPYYHVQKQESPQNPFADKSTPDPVIIWGVDTRIPLVEAERLRLAVFGDVVNQDDRLGGMVGTGGVLRAGPLGILYGGQLRLYEDNFIPTYFDSSYDRRRVERFRVYDGDRDVKGTLGWLARLGFSSAQEGLRFVTTMSGPFEDGTGVGPDLQSTLTIAEGAFPGFPGLSFSGTYQTFDLAKPADILEAEDTLLGIRLNIRSGPVVISLVTDLRHDPLAEGDPWTITSGLETTIAF
ncbi:hypothetical protein SAMN05920897_101196 [Alkalispirochaeta americana]|uniref:Uncharacterized protein n=1 Tax=Alkalispirochaeta americana TaxID=159291 RepID=A0A1N6ND85_9SPIO|nr:hypothetical protein [Alkalispirochaeta americana]SIP90012.1 hypothetical protein SAMN05920897_101196 [Alkalispirochaeta americana]